MHTAVQDPGTHADHTIRARRMALAFDRPDFPRHFMDGDLIMSHVVASMSAVFPEGEDFFVRSVRRFRDRITDPTLKAQVAGFIGQEANHGREHREFNARLARLGYPTERIDRWVRKGMAIDERYRSAEVCLAVTAALEHYTATLAELTLSSEEIRAQFGEPEIYNLMMWHALEESEHKAVAFDVYQEVCGDTKLRKRIMNQITVGFILTSILHTVASLTKDPAARNFSTLRTSFGRLRRSPYASRDVWRRLRDYNRDDFHPADHDNHALTAFWRDALFGVHGSLNDSLRTAAAIPASNDEPVAAAS